MCWISLVAALHDNVAWYKLPVGDGREVLTSAARLKYFHKASHLPTTCTCWTKNFEWVCRKLQGYLISRFNKYSRNPRNFLSPKLISPTVVSLDHIYLGVNYTDYSYRFLVPLAIVEIYVHMNTWCLWFLLITRQLTVVSSYKTIKRSRTEWNDHWAIKTENVVESCLDSSFHL